MGTDILFEACLKIPQRQIKMRRAADNRRGPAQLALRVDKLNNIQPCPAVFTLVAPGGLVSAHRARPFNVPVGQKHLVHFTVQLLLLFLLENILRVEIKKELFRRFMVNRQRRPRIIIEADAQARKRRSVHRVETVNDHLRRYAFFVRRDGDRNSMLVRAADKKDIAMLQPLVPDKNIGRDICTGEMSQMDRSVRVRKSRCYQYSFELTLHSAVFSLTGLIRKAGLTEDTHFPEEVRVPARPR